MIDKDPANYNLLTYLWVFGLSAWGGFISFLQRAKSELPLRRKLSLLATEIVICTFAGLITFFLCGWAQIDPLLSAVMIAISGHMGTRAIVLTERFVEMQFQRIMGLPEKEVDNGDL